ncbi:protein takeout-like [Ostrinia nubilalis]|uniref:protein takeout-like n=1 Tax=Ostrinia nubilalis TaxID=29057 RepID=UPI003082394A
MSQKILLVFVFCVVALAGVNAVPYITKCASHDAKCLKRSTQALLPMFANGMPQYAVQALDPLVIRTVDASTASLQLIVNNMAVTGLKGCVATKIERDLAASKLLTNFLCNVRAEGNYEMHGRLLVLPIEGKGRAQVELNKIQMNVASNIVEKIGKDGKKHWHIKGSSYTYELKDKAHVNFENLFNGNELMSRAAREIIANNGNDIVVEVGPPVIKAIVDKIIENVNHLFRAVPVEELALN